MKQVKPIPSTMPLAPTLARRVNQLREYRNMTVRDLAQISRFKPQRIEDIEGGVETWLSSSDRQLLAKALNIEPALLQEVESRMVAGQNVPESHMLDRTTSEQLATAIVNGARELECPDCGSPLKCSIQEGTDIEGHPIRLAKAYCTKCPFVLR